MRRVVALAALLTAFSAWSQAPEKPEPKEEAAKEEAMKEATAKEPAKVVAKMRFTEKRFEDARHCLERPTNLEIIKCAEEYL